MSSDSSGPSVGFRISCALGSLATGISAYSFLRAGIAATLGGGDPIWLRIDLLAFSFQAPAFVVLVACLGLPGLTYVLAKRSLMAHPKVWRCVWCMKWLADPEVAVTCARHLNRYCSPCSTELSSSPTCRACLAERRPQRGTSGSGAGQGVMPVPSSGAPLDSDYRYDWVNRRPND